MSRKLQIIFKRPQRRFMPGQLVEGEVVVEVKKETRCKKLEVSNFWRTHGKGNRDVGGRTETILFEGTWQPGTYRYPFAFEAMSWPMSYHGKYLNVDWYVGATADVPWAFDPSHEADYLLIPGQDEARRAFPSSASFESEVITTNGGLWIGAFGGATLLFGGVFLIIGLASNEGFGFLLAGGLVVLIALFLFIMMIKSMMAQNKVGPVSLGLEPSPSHPGALMSAKLSFTPQSDAELNGILATIRGKEVCVSGSGTNRTTHTNVFHEETIRLLGAGSFPAGREVDASGTFTLPEDAPFSFSASDNKIVWEVQYHIDIARWPDWKQSRQFSVGLPPIKRGTAW